MGKIKTNEVKLSGDITKDFEARKTTTDKDWAYFSISVDNSKKINGEWENEKFFVNCKTFSSTVCANLRGLTQWSTIKVIGKLKQDEYNGKKQFYLLVDSVEIIEIK